jgi:hypothetical protein
MVHPVFIASEVSGSEDADLLVGSRPLDSNPWETLMSWASSSAGLKSL